MKTISSKLTGMLFSNIGVLIITVPLLVCTVSPALGEQSISEGDPAALNAASPGAGEQSTSKVRQPEKGADLEAFWDEFDWTELTPEEQRLWGILGWDKSSWQGDSPEPASEAKDWDNLTKEEQEAAVQLGYDEAYWNSIP